MTLKLPDVVYLPTGVSLHPTEVRDACGGISRAGMMWWRKHHGFPAFYGTNNQSYYMAGQVAAWIRRQGAVVRWL